MRTKTNRVHRAASFVAVAAITVVPLIAGKAHSSDSFSSLRFAITTGPSAGERPAEFFPWSTPIGVLVDGRANGPTVFGGNGCDRATVPARDSNQLDLDRHEEATIVFSGDGCSSSYKVESGQLAGYGFVLVATTHDGAEQGAAPDAVACPPKNHQFTSTLPAACVGHRTMHDLFGSTPLYTGSDADVAVGARGESVAAVTDSDGDGLLDPVDNCKLTANADQDDSDQDSLGDPCDPWRGIPYSFTGFFAPIEDRPAVNNVKAGAVIPVKFSLDGFQGMNIFAPNSPRTTSIACDFSSPPIGADVIDTSGSTTVTYDPDFDQYIVVWKTERGWANSCRQLDIELTDGSHHQANFRFTR